MEHHLAILRRSMQVLLLFELKRDDQELRRIRQNLMQVMIPILWSYTIDCLSLPIHAYSHANYL